MRPRIAIPADTLTEATNVINNRNAPYAPRPLIEAIVKSGGVPVIFPSVDPKFIEDYIDMFDGIIFAGGVDVDPTFYNEEPHLHLGMTYLKRDIFEIELLKQAVKNGKAILGICRGMQLINVSLGGTLYQDLSENKSIYVKHAQDAPGNFPSHHANIKADSRLHQLIGERPYINSRHHQVLKQIAPTLRVVANADDGVVEAVESIDSDQILGLQWHPENTFKHYQISKNIFADLIERSKKVAEKERTAR